MTGYKLTRLPIVVVCKLTIINNTVMKIYVAGAFVDKTEIRQFMDKVEKLGNQITHDWTSYELVYNDHHERNIKCATADIDGVIDADLVIAIMTRDDYPYKGTKHELGAAFTMQRLALRGMVSKCPEVWAVVNGNYQTDPEHCPEFIKTCFSALISRWFTSTDQILELL